MLPTTSSQPRAHRPPLPGRWRVAVPLSWRRSRELVRGWLHWLLLTLVLLYPSAGAASPGFEVLSAQVALKDAVYRVSARFDFRLSEKALQALHNGVPLTLEVEMLVTEHRRYLWNAILASVVQRYRLRYHALSQQYQVENLNTGVTESYPSRLAALGAIGRIDEFPLIDAGLVPPDGRYQVEIQLRLDIESLPVPLRALAYLSPDWHLDSAWSEVPLRAGQ